MAEVTENTRGLSVKDIRNAAFVAAFGLTMQGGSESLGACPDWCYWDCGTNPCFLAYPCENTCDEYCNQACFTSLLNEDFMGGCSYEECNFDYCECDLLNDR